MLIQGIYRYHITYWRERPARGKHRCGFSPRWLVLRKWIKVILHNKLSMISAILSISVTIAVIVALGQLTDGVLHSYEEIRLAASHYDDSFSSLSEAQAASLREALAAKRLDVQGVVIEKRVGVYEDELGLAVEWLEVEGDPGLILGIQCTSGRMPQSPDEVCITQTYLEKTGLADGLGDQITASVLTDGGDVIEKKATIVGILDRYTSMTSDFCTISTAGPDMPAGTVATDVLKKPVQSYTAYFLYKEEDSLAVGSAFSRITYLLTGSTDYSTIKSLGITLSGTNDKSAQEYTKEQSVFLLMPYLLVIAVLFLIVSVIFVRMIVGVMLTMRRSDLGILLALGLSRKRLKQILFFEAGLFTGAAACFGLPLSYFFYQGIYEGVRNMSAVGYISRSMSPSAILAALLSVLVGVSLAYGSAYMKMARNQPYSYFEQSKDVANVSIKKNQRPTGAGPLFIAQRNLERNAARTFGILRLQFFACGFIMISIILFSALQNGTKDYLKGLMGTVSSDYSIGSNTKVGQFFAPETVENMQGLEGIENAYPVWFVCAEINGSPSAIYIYSEEFMIGSGLEAGETPLLYAMDRTTMIGGSRQSFSANENVTLQDTNGTSLAETKIHDLVSPQMFYGYGNYPKDELICNEAFAHAYLQDLPLRCSTILVRTELSYMELQNTLVEGDLWQAGNWIDFHKTGMTEAENQLRFVTSMAGIFGATILLFLLVSMINMTHQLCLLRSKEYAVLEAIGFRKKDIFHIVSLEMTLISILSMILSLIGACLIYTAIYKSIGFDVSLLWCGIFAAAFVFLSFISSQIVSRFAIDKSMFERLCEVER